MNIISTESQKLLNLYEQMLIQHQQRGINGLNQMPMQNYHHQSQLSLQIKSSLQNTSSSSSSSSSSSHTSSNVSSNSSLCSSKSQQSSPSNSSQSPPPQSVNKSSTPTQQSYPPTSNLDAFSAENSYRAYMAAALAAAAAAASNTAAATFPYQFIQSQQQQQSVVANQLEYANNGYSYVASNNSNRLPSKPSQMQVSNNVQLNQPRSNTVTSSSFKARSSLGSSVGSSSSSSGGGGGNALEEPPKPAHSYIGLIAIAILSSPEKRLVLSDIYQYILDNYSYFHNRGSGWRNSIRHNLSLNDCFMKSGRSANGKGHYWTIHPANLEDFSRGDFRRRRAQRRVRRSLGLTVPEEDDEDDDDVLIPTTLPCDVGVDDGSSPSSLSPSPSSSMSFKNAALINSPFNPPHFFRNTVAPNVGVGYMNQSRLFDNVVLPSSSSSLAAKRGLDCDDTNDENCHNKRKMFKQDDEVDDDPSYSDHQSECESEDSPGAEYNEKEEAVFKFKPEEKSIPITETNNNNNNDNSVEETENSEAENGENETATTTTTTTERCKEETNQPSKSSNDRKRSAFDVEALLAPDTSSKKQQPSSSKNSSEPSSKQCSSRQTNNNASSNNNKPSSRSSKSSSSFNHHHHHSNHNHSNTRNGTARILGNFVENNSNSPFSKVESDNEDVEKWKQTFSKIMARSYKNNSNVCSSSYSTKK